MNFSTLSLTVICVHGFILIGCSPTKLADLDLEAPELKAPAPLFCDVEEPRRFTQAEIDWRAEHAPTNLRKDIKTNLTWDAECAPKKSEATE